MLRSVMLMKRMTSLQQAYSFNCMPCLVSIMLTVSCLLVKHVSHGHAESLAGDMVNKH
jgi:hypothetical protein